MLGMKMLSILVRGGGWMSSALHICTGAQYAVMALQNFIQHVSRWSHYLNYMDCAFQC